MRVCDVLSMFSRSMLSGDCFVGYICIREHFRQKHYCHFSEQNSISASLQFSEVDGFELDIFVNWVDNVLYIDLREEYE